MAAMVHGGYSPTQPPHKTILQGWLLQQEHLIALPTPSDGRPRFYTTLFDNLFRTSTVLSSWLSGLVCQYLELSQRHMDPGFQAPKKWLQTLGLFATHLCPCAWFVRQRWPAVWTQKLWKSNPKPTNLLIALVGWEAAGKPTLSVFGLLLVWKMTSLSSENGKLGGPRERRMSQVFRNVQSPLFEGLLPPELLTKYSSILLAEAVSGKIKLCCMKWT